MKTNGSSAAIMTSPSSNANPKPFERATEKVTIVSLEKGVELSVAAQYNPKELGISKTIQWQDPKLLDNREAQKRKPNEGKDSEYTGGGQRNMTLELFFDSFEKHGYKPAKPIEDIMDDLNTLASIRDPAGKEEERRPHYCVVVWGVGGIRPFRCVIESLDIKYTMFDTNGVPLRAVATVKVRESAMPIELSKPEVRSLNGRTAR
ncbi:MAG TPA: hypothetical protein VIU61_13520 [Kofleriaceae bacterium]